MTEHSIVSTVLAEEDVACWGCRARPATTRWALPRIRHVVPDRFNQLKVGDLTYVAVTQEARYP